MKKKILSLICVVFVLLFLSSNLYSVPTENKEIKRVDSFDKIYYEYTYGVGLWGIVEIDEEETSISFKTGILSGDDISYIVSSLESLLLEGSSEYIAGEDKIVLRYPSLKDTPREDIYSLLNGGIFIVNAYLDNLTQVQSLKKSDDYFTLTFNLFGDEVESKCFNDRLEITTSNSTNIEFLKYLFSLYNPHYVEWKIEDGVFHFEKNINDNECKRMLSSLSRLALSYLPMPIDDDFNDSFNSQEVEDETLNFTYYYGVGFSLSGEIDTSDANFTLSSAITTGDDRKEIFSILSSLFALTSREEENNTIHLTFNNKINKEDIKDKIYSSLDSYLDSISGVDTLLSDNNKIYNNISLFGKKGYIEAEKDEVRVYTSEKLSEEEGKTLYEVTKEYIPYFDAFDISINGSKITTKYPFTLSEIDRKRIVSSFTLISLSYEPMPIEENHNEKEEEISLNKEKGKASIVASFGYLFSSKEFDILLSFDYRFNTLIGASLFGGVKIPSPSFIAGLSVNFSLDDDIFTKVLAYYQGGRNLIFFGGAIGLDYYFNNRFALCIEADLGAVYSFIEKGFGFQGSINVGLRVSF